MSIRLFKYENFEVKLNESEMLLVPEFRDLFSIKYNKGMKGDKDGMKRKKAFQAGAYMYLVYDWKSPWADFPEEERIREVLSDSELTKDDLVDPILTAAIAKYKKLQTTIKIMALDAAKTGLHKIIAHIYSVDLNERGGEANKPVFAAKDLLDATQKMEKNFESIDRLEEMVKKDLEKENELLGSNKRGLFD